MYDLVIRNGQIVDGTGNPSFHGDIGINDGRIAKVANNSQGEAITGNAKETIDAAGAIVAPGWVDTHSHMDGQATWDP
jgi:N-acyl-D-aspartate/D-glutamate deacylase